MRRPIRRGVLIFSCANILTPPWLRALGRPRGEAAPQVAEPLLLHLGVRAEVLPQGRHPLREHPRCRQGDVRRVLPDGPVARTHLRRDARRALPRPRLAEIPPRERGARLQVGQLMGNTAFDAAAAGGSVDTAVGFPKSREEMYEFYGFIRKQTRDAASG